MNTPKNNKNQRSKKQKNRSSKTDHNHSIPHQIGTPNYSSASTMKKKHREASVNRSEHVNEANELQPMHALLAKDSEWVDVLHTTRAAVERASSSTNPSDDRIIPLDEALSETTPFAAMFPGLVQRDPQALEGIATRTMSTTEITRRLVNLDERADLTARKMERLIPKNKQWLEPVMENSIMETATISTNANESMVTDSVNDHSTSNKEQYQNELFFFGNGKHKKK